MDRFEQEGFQGVETNVVPDGLNDESIPRTNFERASAQNTTPGA